VSLDALAVGAPAIDLGAYPRLLEEEPFDLSEIGEDLLSDSLESADDYPRYRSLFNFLGIASKAATTQSNMTTLAQHFFVGDEKGSKSGKIKGVTHHMKMGSKSQKVSGKSGKIDHGGKSGKSSKSSGATDSGSVYIYDVIVASWGDNYHFGCPPTIKPTPTPTKSPTRRPVSYSLPSYWHG
jgi:hypothetical protein